MDYANAAVCGNQTIQLLKNMHIKEYVLYDADVDAAVMNERFKSIFS